MPTQQATAPTSMFFPQQTPQQPPARPTMFAQNQPMMFSSPQQFQMRPNNNSFNVSSSSYDEEARCTDNLE